MRGLLRAQEQCLLSAACQNIKKMALLLCKPEKKSEKDSIYQLGRLLLGWINAINPVFGPFLA